jgi:hypothetical protein
MVATTIQKLDNRAKRALVSHGLDVPLILLVSSGNAVGFTGSTVTARYGSIIHMYDEKGMTVYSKAA